jgi:hypothetical protein
VNNTANAFDKFEVPPQPPDVRYQVWKFHVEPARIQPLVGVVERICALIPGPIEPVPEPVAYGGMR